MKARVKATGEIVEIIKIENNLFIDSYCCQYEPYEIEWEINDDDYWTRLEHQAAIAAMGGMCGNTKYNDYAWVDMAKFAIKAAHILVEKMKEKEERK